MEVTWAPWAWRWCYLEELWTCPFALNRSVFEGQFNRKCHCKMCECHEDTFCKWTWTVVDLLAGLDIDALCLIVACFLFVFVIFLSHNVSICIYFSDCWTVPFHAIPCLILDCLGELQGRGYWWRLFGDSWWYGLPNDTARWPEKILRAQIQEDEHSVWNWCLYQDRMVCVDSWTLSMWWLTWYQKVFGMV